MPIINIFILTTASFLLSFIFTPLVTTVLYKYKLGKNIRSNGDTPVFTSLHEKKRGTPTMGGILVWATVLMLTGVIYFFARWTGISWLKALDISNRSETWLPLAALGCAAVVGLIDDIVDIHKAGKFGSGIRFRMKFLIYVLMALVGAWWFYVKLDWNVLRVPLFGTYEIGIWTIVLFLGVFIGTSFSVNEIDGLDGLAGGTLLAAFVAYGTIAFAQGRYDLAALCGMIVGALLSFLWFNIPPARFFMGDTGAMSLGVTLGVIALLTNYALLLPIIGLLFVIEALSVIIQLISKKVFHKKVFICAPIHHHLEAKGWTESKIVMRFWIISAVTAVIGVVIALMDIGR